MPADHARIRQIRQETASTPCSPPTPSCRARTSRADWDAGGARELVGLQLPERPHPRRRRGDRPAPERLAREPAPPRCSPRSAPRPGRSTSTPGRPPRSTRGRPSATTSKDPTIDRRIPPTASAQSPISTPARPTTYRGRPRPAAADRPCPTGVSSPHATASAAARTAAASERVIRPSSGSGRPVGDSAPRTPTASAALPEGSTATRLTRRDR